MLAGSEKIMGIDEYTSMWIDLHGKMLKVNRKGQIHLVESDQENSIDFNNKGPFTLLSNFRPLTDLRNGIRKDIWMQVVDKNRDASVRFAGNPSREMIDMVHQREEARRVGDQFLRMASH